MYNTELRPRSIRQYTTYSILQLLLGSQIMRWGNKCSLLLNYIHMISVVFIKVKRCSCDLKNTIKLTLYSTRHQLHVITEYIKNTYVEYISKHCWKWKHNVNHYCFLAWCVTFYIFKLLIQWRTFCIIWDSFMFQRYLYNKQYWISQLRTKSVITPVLVQLYWDIRLVSVIYPQIYRRFS